MYLLNSQEKKNIENFETHRRYGFRAYVLGYYFLYIPNIPKITFPELIDDEIFDLAPWPFSNAPISMIYSAKKKSFPHEPVGDSKLNVYYDFLWKKKNWPIQKIKKNNEPLKYCTFDFLKFAQQKNDELWNSAVQMCSYKKLDIIKCHTISQKYFNRKDPLEFLRVYRAKKEPYSVINTKLQSQIKFESEIRTLYDFQKLKNGNYTLSEIFELFATNFWICVNNKKTFYRKKILEDNNEIYRFSFCLKERNPFKHQLFPKILVDGKKQNLSQLFKIACSEAVVPYIRETVMRPYFYLKDDPYQQSESYLNIYERNFFSYTKFDEIDIKKTTVWFVLKEIICENNEHKLKWILTYLYMKIFECYRKVEKVLILTSKFQGIGKSSFMMLLKKLLQNYRVVKLNSIKQLMENFNSKLEFPLIVYIDDLNRKLSESETVSLREVTTQKS